MGNTVSALARLISLKDHPHIHGEYQSKLNANLIKEGSPPHTWGIPAWETEVGEPVRITPTYMGNTSTAIIPQRSVQDHPHIHGEYTACVSQEREFLGSPPHTWGILKPVAVAIMQRRITPTYMGNTHPFSCNVASKRDHPHIHGEYLTHGL